MSPPLSPLKKWAVSQRKKKHQIVDGVLCIQSTPQASDQNNSEVAVRYNDNATMEKAIQVNSIPYNRNDSTSTCLETFNEI